eukprot:14376753-Ditylum_brightwellii.AAC.1
MDIPKHMESFGSLRLLWEGGYSGEGANDESAVISGLSINGATRETLDDSHDETNLDDVVRYD